MRLIKPERYPVVEIGIEFSPFFQFARRYGNYSARVRYQPADLLVNVRNRLREAVRVREREGTPVGRLLNAMTVKHADGVALDGQVVVQLCELADMSPTSEILRAQSIYCRSRPWSNCSLLRRPTWITALVTTRLGEP